MTQVFGFDSESSIDRVISAVRKVEASRPAAQSPRAGFADPTAILKITGEGIGDVQPADIISWDHAAGAEKVIGDGVRFKELNGLALPVGTYVMGRLSGFTSDSNYALFVGAMSDCRLWVEITGGTDAAGYSGTRKAMASPGSWLSYPAADPLTFDATIFRAPSNTVTGPGGPPDLEAGQVVEVVPSLTQPGYWETKGGSLQEVEIQFPWSWQINTGSPCTITVATTKTLRITGRDLKADVV